VDPADAAEPSVEPEPAAVLLGELGKGAKPLEHPVTATELPITNPVAIAVRSKKEGKARKPREIILAFRRSKVRARTRGARAPENSVRLLRSPVPTCARADVEVAVPLQSQAQRSAPVPLPGPLASAVPGPLRPRWNPGPLFKKI
jgi:hypothetical protein